MKLILASIVCLVVLSGASAQTALKPPTESALDRFLRYVKIDTQSAEDQQTVPSTRKQLKDMLGVDVDLRYIKTQCRVGQGNLDRELMTRLSFLKSELVRCNDTI